MDGRSLGSPWRLAHIARPVGWVSRRWWHQRRAKLILLGAPAHGVGPVQYFSLPALSKGWYRVGYPSQYRPAVYGVVGVDPAAPMPVPIDNPGRPTCWP